MIAISRVRAAFEIQELKRSDVDDEPVLSLTIVPGGMVMVPPSPDPSVTQTPG